MKTRKTAKSEIATSRGNMHGAPTVHVEQFTAFNLKQAVIRPLLKKVGWTKVK